VDSQHVMNCWREQQLYVLLISGARHDARDGCAAAAVASMLVHVGSRSCSAGRVRDVCKKEQAQHALCAESCGHAFPCFWRVGTLSGCPTWRLYRCQPPLAACLLSAFATSQQHTTMSSRAHASSLGTLSAMQVVDKVAPSGRTCFDLLENALLTRITDLLSGKDLVRFAASCKRFAGLEKESSQLKHAKLCAHFTAAGAADTVTWLTSNRGRVFSTFIVVTGAPYSVLERLVEAPEFPPLVFPNSELFAALERHIASDAKVVHAAMAHARAVYAATLERGDDVVVAREAAEHALNEQLDRHRPGELSLLNADQTLDIWDDVHVDTLQRRGTQLTLHYEGDFSNEVDQWDIDPWRLSTFGGCSLRLKLGRCHQDGNFRGFVEETTGIEFDNDTNTWLLAASLYLVVAEWLEREVGREDAGYEWQSSSWGMEILYRISVNDPELTTQCVSDEVIGTAGASALADALEMNNTLTKLLITAASIGDAGASALAAALKVNNTLTELNVAGNSIGEAGASALAEALKVNKTLTTLDICVDDIGDAGASALAEVLKLNKTLTTLHVSGNSIGADGASALAEALKVNNTLTMLNVDCNNISDAGASALAEALKVNKSLTELDVSFNSIGEAGASALAGALKLNKTRTLMAWSKGLIRGVCPGCTVRVQCTH
jgi:Leucine Rich repeat